MLINELQCSLSAYEHCLSSKKSILAIENALQYQLKMMTKKKILNKVEYN